MLVVALFAFLLAPLMRWKLLVIAISVGGGLAAAWGMGNLRILDRVWFDAWAYWAELPGVLRPGNVQSDPTVFLGVLIFGWIAPVLLAWATVRMRTRARLGPSEDQPPPAS
jgi:hypothetical protein